MVENALDKIIKKKEQRLKDLKKLVKINLLLILKKKLNLILLIIKFHSLQKLRKQALLLV
jgi:hypothetical protein